jgi:hypothetical protein
LPGNVEDGATELSYLCRIPQRVQSVQKGSVGDKERTDERAVGSRTRNQGDQHRQSDQGKMQAPHNQAPFEIEPERLPSIRAEIHNPGL